MASTVIGPAADTIVTFLAANGFTGYRWARQDMDLPAGVVELPTIERKRHNSQLGADDWDLDYQIALYFPLESAVEDADRAAEAVEDFIAAVDANPSLSDPTIVEDAVVTSADPSYETDGSRPMIVYVCHLELTKLVH